MLTNISYLNGSLRNLSVHQFPKPWQVAEWYLDYRSKGYRVTELDLGTITLTDQVKKKDMIMTALKVVSYIVFILPLLAYCIRQHYRTQYLFQKLEKTQRQVPKPLSLADKDAATFAQLQAQFSQLEQTFQEFAKLSGLINTRPSQTD